MTVLPTVEVMYCYAPEDKDLFERLEVHLDSLKHSYNLITWSDRNILPGDDSDEAITTHLLIADLTLLLLSPDFLHSDACDKEMQRALEQHR